MPVRRHKCVFSVNYILVYQSTLFPSSPTAALANPGPPHSDLLTAVIAIFSSHHYPPTRETQLLARFLLSVQPDANYEQNEKTTQNQTQCYETHQLRRHAPRCAVHYPNTWYGCRRSMPQIQPPVDKTGLEEGEPAFSS